MTKSNIHKALGVAALLGIALLAGCHVGARAKVTHLRA